MHILVTAGPTREYLDEVRFLSNPSSGRMGFACAREARRRGHRVTLVTGPVDIPDPRGVRTVRVISAEEMRRAVLDAYPGADAVLMTAAVSDYRPERREAGKIKKTGRGRTLRLAPTRDILAELGRRKGGRVLVGFALEVQEPVRNALGKLRRKNLDYVVLNSPRAFGGGRVRARVFTAAGPSKEFRGVPKETLARWLIREIESARLG